MSSRAITATITTGQDVNAGSLYAGVATTNFKIQQNAGDSFVDNSNFTPIFQLEGNAVPADLYTSPPVSHVKW